MKKLALIVATLVMSASSFAGSWHLSKRTDLINDNKTVTISKFSQWGTFGRTKDLLLVRTNCKSKKTEVFMSHGWLIKGAKIGGIYKTFPLIRFDKTKAKQELMELSTNWKAMFVPQTKTKNFVKRMKKHNQLVMRFESSGSSWKTTLFKLKGFTKAMKKVAKACK